MTLAFTCRISGPDLLCRLTVDRALKAPVLCCSGMAPLTVTEGGERLFGLGSYIEVQLPDLASGQTHSFVLAYEGGYKPANRAWMPMGAYLRTDDGCLPLPALKLGARPEVIPDGPPHDGLGLLPEPQSWTPSGGVVVARGFSVSDPGFAAVEALAGRLGLGPFLSETGLPVVLQDSDLSDEAYHLDITNDRVILSSGSASGRFYGAISLLMLLHTHQGRLPCGKVKDAPRFGWRGQHLDCARHFYDSQSIHDLLDLMALLKLNRFHWHFADDEAFRLEIDYLPELWQKTALRGEGHLIPAVFSGGVEAGGSYSKSDAAALVARGQELFIEIMPEIEVPAHALALAKVFPDVLDPEDTGTERSVQGYPYNVTNPAMPKTWEVLTALATEVGGLFPFGVLHLGGDELPGDTWMGSARARHLMAGEGLSTTHDLQGWTMARLAETVVANGQRPAAWEEAARGCNGGIGHGAILFSWTGQGPGIAAARAGYDVVMTPAQHVYLDMAATDDPDDWGANWAAYVSLADTIAWDPVPADAPELAPRILGVQGCFWSEFTSQDGQMWPMLLPRMLGVSAKAWQTGAMAPERLHALARLFMGLDALPVKRALGAA